jgi:hypothetical protein
MNRIEEELLFRVCPHSNPDFHRHFSQTSAEEIILRRLEGWGYVEKINSRWTSTPVGDRFVLDHMSDN